MQVISKNQLKNVQGGSIIGVMVYSTIGFWVGGITGFCASGIWGSVAGAVCGTAIGAYLGTDGPQPIYYVVKPSDNNQPIPVQ